MEAILEDIGAVLGVTGCFICDDAGEVLACTLPSIFDDHILSVVGRTISQTTAGLVTARRRKIQEIDLVFSEGRVVIKPLREGCLCVLCARSMNVPLLNLTANVAARKLTEVMRRDGSEPEPVQPEDAAVEQALYRVVDSYPDVVSPVLDLEQSLADNKRGPVLTTLGQRVGAIVFQRRYSSMNIPASINQVLELVPVPALSPFAIANAQANGLDVLACPFCRNLPSPSPRCYFLAGFIQGLLNSIRGLGDVQVAETFCRAKGDDTCSFVAEAKQG